MRSIRKRAQELAESSRRIPQEQEISATAPGTILADVRTLLHQIGPTGIRAKSKTGNLPPELLPGLNFQLSAPIELHLDRPLLRDYPNIAGLYILLRPTYSQSQDRNNSQELFAVE